MKIRPWLSIETIINSTRSSEFAEGSKLSFIAITNFQIRLDTKNWREWFTVKQKVSTQNLSYIICIFTEIPRKSSVDKLFDIRYFSPKDYGSNFENRQKKVTATNVDRNIFWIWRNFYERNWFILGSLRVCKCNANGGFSQKLASLRITCEYFMTFSIRRAFFLESRCAQTFFSPKKKLRFPTPKVDEGSKSQGCQKEFRRFLYLISLLFWVKRCLCSAQLPR